MKLSKIRAMLCVMSMLLLLLSDALALEAYEPAGAEIPFRFINQSETEHECTVIIEYDGDMPKPDADKKSVKNGEWGSFLVSVKKPGIYTYKVYQEIKDDESIIFDDTVYTVSVYATNGETDGELAVMISAGASGMDGKPDEIKFENHTFSISDKPAPPAAGGAPKTGERPVMSIVYLVMLISGEMMAVSIIIGRKREN